MKGSLEKEQEHIAAESGCLGITATSPAWEPLKVRSAGVGTGDTLCSSGSVVPVSGVDFSFLFGSLQLFGVGLVRNSLYKSTKWLSRPAHPSSPPPTPHHNTYPVPQPTEPPPRSSVRGRQEAGRGKRALPHKATPHSRRARLGSPAVGPPFCQPWGTPKPPPLHPVC